MKVVIASPFNTPDKGVLGMYAMGCGEAFEKRGMQVETVVFSMYAHLPPGFRHLAFFFKLFSAARGASFILALDTWSVGFPALWATKILRIPLILRIGGDFLWESYVQRTKKRVRLSDFYAERSSFSLKEKMFFTTTKQVLTGARALLFNTRFQIDLWQPIYGFDRAKARVCENMYPKRVDELREARGRVFVSAGRHIALKNYAELERVFARVKVQYPDIELDMNLVPPPENKARLALAYAVIIPSLSEMSSNMAIASVTAGKPFIMTADTGTKERLGACGLFIDTRSEEAIERAILTLLNDEEYMRLAKACAEFSFVHSWDDIVEEITKAL